jgi:hypothetical protein
MQKFLLSAILFFLVLISFSLFFFFYETRYFGSRASMTRVDISTDNSFVVSAPSRAQADGKDKIRVTVLVLNTEGLGIFGKNVSLAFNPQVTMNVIQAATDSTGKAIFDMSSTVPGDYYLDVHVDQIVLPQKAHLQFY